jgi:hypothetical protein
LYKPDNIETDATFLNVDNIPEYIYKFDESIQHSSDIKCLVVQQYTLYWNDDIYLEISPGQNNKPLSIIYNEDTEELSFPSIYLGEARTFETNVKVTPFMMVTISCNSMVFGRKVDNLSCTNYVSYLSYHRPILRTTNHHSS